MENFNESIANEANTQALLAKMESLSGATMIDLIGYKNGKGEVCNYTILVAYNEEMILRGDIEKIASVTPTILEKIAKETGIELNIVLEAYNELVISKTQAIDTKLADKSNQAKAQIEAYTHWSDGIKCHNMTGEIMIYGILKHRELITPGEPKKPVNSRPKTIAKNAISKLCKFGMDEFVMFKFDSIKAINVDGTSITLNR